ncbi:MAG: glycosyltransferase family 2 protein, partial [Peptococcaceae bacterium]|nr:glycosyltransferase family 2 protein [Peptococcaceae bacterium]
MEEPIVETNNQKVLSIAIPSYNSEAYMANCIESLLIGGDDVEILIVNDGSKDGTAQIADAYAAKYPNIIRAVHQENGGHGEAVNAGLRNATGRYFKVVDSDDWVDP